MVSVSYPRCGMAAKAGGPAAKSSGRAVNEQTNRRERRYDLRFSLVRIWQNDTQINNTNKFSKASNARTHNGVRVDNLGARR